MITVRSKRKRHKRVRKYQRQWLNNHGMAALCTNLAFEEGTYKSAKDKKETEYQEVSASVILQDCNRNVTIDFSTYDKKDVAERRKKLDLLINTLTKFRADWEEQAKKIK